MLGKAYVGHLFDYETGKRLRLATPAEAALAKRSGGALVVNNRVVTLQHIAAVPPQQPKTVRVTLDQKHLLRHLPKDGSSISRHALFEALQDAGWRRGEIEHAIGPLLTSGVLGENTSGLFNARAPTAVARHAGTAVGRQTLGG